MWIRKQQLVLTQDLPPLHYDYLILATGASSNYFGHPEWESIAPGMKNMFDGLEVQQTILGAFEAAEKEPDEKERKRLLTFVFIGAGPTGVELAAASAVHINHILGGNFQRIGPGDARLVLVQGPDRVLPTFRPELTEKVEKKLKEQGVEIIKGVHVKEIDENGVQVGDEYIETHNAFWLAGVSASPAGKWLGAECDRGGRVKVQSDLSVPESSQHFCDWRYCLRSARWQTAAWGRATGYPGRALCGQSDCRQGCWQRA